jgi:hypothetical protein
MAYYRQIPGGGFVIQTGTRLAQVAGTAFAIETVPAAGGGGTDTGLFDGKIRILNTATDTFDGKARVLSTAVSLVDGKLVVQGAAVAPFDGKLVVITSGGQTEIFDGKAIIKSAATLTFDGKARILSVATPTFDGKVVVQVFTTDTDTFDGLVSVGTATVDLFDGKAVLSAGTTTLTAADLDLIRQIVREMLPEFAAAVWSDADAYNTGEKGTDLKIAKLAAQTAAVLSA